MISKKNRVIFGLFTIFKKKQGKRILFSIISFVFFGCKLLNNSRKISFNKKDITPGHYTATQENNRIFWSLNLNKNQDYFVQVFWELNQCELRGNDTTGFIRCQYANDGIASEWEEIRPLFEKESNFKNVTETSFGYYSPDYFTRIFWGSDPSTLQKKSSEQVNTIDWVEFIKD